MRGSLPCAYAMRRCRLRRSDAVKDSSAMGGTTSVTAAPARGLRRVITQRLARERLAHAVPRQARGPAVGVSHNVAQRSRGRPPAPAARRPHARAHGKHNVHTRTHRCSCPQRRQTPPPCRPCFPSCLKCPFSERRSDRVPSHALSTTCGLYSVNRSRCEIQSQGQLRGQVSGNSTGTENLAHMQRSRLVKRAPFQSRF